MSRFSRSVVALAVISTLSGFARAQPADGRWQVVMADQKESVALDTTRIAKGFRGTTAWSRINLGRDVPDMVGSYNAIEAENLYECGAGKFTTLRRVYFKGDTPVREEAAVRDRANKVLVGSIDERLLNEACKARVTETAEAAAAGKAAQLANSTEDMIGERPAPMVADMRTLGKDKGARVLRVADAHGAAAGAEKPRMIDLPKIDKEAAAREAAAAGVAAPAAAAGGAAKPAAPAPDIHSTAAAASSVAPKAVPAIPDRVMPAATAAAKPAALPADLGVSGHARELMLATSGPKKSAAKKKEVNPAEEMHVHWGYEGAGAPANWGKIDPKNATCDSGKRQSPIDIRPGISVDLEEIKFAYKKTKFNVFDNGHTVQVNVGAGNTITVMGKRYELVQFHFHKPSEERVNGRPYPMVIHFVHKDWDDNLAVIAVLLDEGTEHPVLQTVWNNMPLEPNSEVQAQDILEPMKLMPDNRAYWTYMGSLTTPPCTENVLWMVMKNPVLISPEQIGIFARLYKNNARPIQPSNGRLVKESR